MPTRTALRHVGPGNVAVDNCPVPKPGPGEVLIKVAAVALNPIDWKMMYRQALAEPTILGCDFAGVVQCLGDHVDRLQVGDRVAGMIQGGNTLRPDDGAFADYLVAQAHILVRLPPNILFEEGSTLPTALFTAGFCLYRHLSFPHPQESGEAQSVLPVLFIYGGGTAIGSMQIQLAKLSGLYVISTSSPDSFDFVKQCGADEVFDYRDPLCAQHIIKASGGKRLATVDCISNNVSSAICAAAMEPKGGIYIACTRSSPDIENPTVKTIRIVAFTVLGRPFSLDAQGPIFPIVLEDVKFASDFVSRAERLLRDNKIQPIQASVRDGGLTAIAEGLVDLKLGTVSRARLVYPIHSC
ncbi:zinc-binding oxidoreductase [Fusarium mundagurra]|uniref:Zinc-binding oxidoreductase n=1 Tax=Fusarium mundagurra TaxID=1567541 RepID=A0A8H6DPR5_9HYPO|nr:zinc-binding oxidoreductase [Fusarium mundagurra]